MATENKMGVMPLNRLLISMSVPMMISMLVQALYNIVDSMFVAQLSENALTAVSLAFPAQNLMIAVATGTGVGVNAALSRNLGEKNFDRANRIADHALFLAAMSYIVFALFGLFFARQFFRLQTDIEEIVDLGTTYLRVCTIASTIAFLVYSVVFSFSLCASALSSFFVSIPSVLGLIMPCRQRSSAVIYDDK